MAYTALSAVFYSLHTVVGNGAINKFAICFQWRNEHFKPRMLLFYVGYGAMNAPWNWQHIIACSAMLATSWGDQCKNISFWRSQPPMGTNIKVPGWPWLWSMCGCCEPVTKGLWSVQSWKSRLSRMCLNVWWRWRRREAPGQTSSNSILQVVAWK